MRAYGILKLIEQKLKYLPPHFFFIVSAARVYIIARFFLLVCLAFL